MVNGIKYKPAQPPDKWLLNGELAQLARALAWHARGHRFDSGILHPDNQSLTDTSVRLFSLW